ncbi:MAG: hypothetical protein Q9227_002329 [Pyrenula ochraceoflavens]
MKTQQIISVLSLMTAASARPFKREVPQEHSHEQFLTTVRASLQQNNPAQIQDPVFGLLGDGAAAAGAGSIADLACLHQATADQAFTNAKAAGDVDGMTAALVYAALERNTAKVGQASAACTSIQATNPEIGAIQQHQDPASVNAAATNKQITLNLAQQIASIGGDPTTALKAGTFAPGDVNDPTGAGNSCDDQNDPVGCIFSQNLLVEDATVDEINAAVAGGAGAGTGAAASNATGAAAATGTGAAGSAASTGSANTGAGSSAGSDSTSCGAAPAAAPASAGTGTAASSSSASTGAVAAPAAASSSTATSTSSAGGSSTIGSCTNADPTVIFANGLDGRTDPAFAPNDTTNFNHGSALNIKVVADFICQQLQDKCKASAAQVQQCQGAATSAEALTGQASADAFNQGVVGL